MSVDNFGCHNEGRKGLGCDTGIWWVEVRMLLNIPQGTGQPQTKNDPVQMSVAPRLRNPVLVAARGLRFCVSDKLLEDTQHSWVHILSGKDRGAFALLCSRYHMCKPYM